MGNTQKGGAAGRQHVFEMAQRITDKNQLKEQTDKILKSRPASRQDVRKRLLHSGADKKVLEEVLETIDWKKQARICAQQEASDKWATPDLIAAALAAHGFTRPERIQALQSIDLIPRGIKAARRANASDDIGPGRIREELEKDGYAPTQIETIIERLGIDWDERLKDFIQKMLDDGRCRAEITENINGFGHDMNKARGILRALRTDWKQQAQLRVERMAVRCYTPRMIQEEMLEVGFTASQIDYAFRRFRLFGTQALANRVIPAYLEEIGASKEMVCGLMTQAGFTDEQIRVACDHNHIDQVNWLKTSVEPIRRLVEEADDLSRAVTKQALSAQGYSDKQISHAFQVIRPEWEKHALTRALDCLDGLSAWTEHEMHRNLRRKMFRNADIDYALKHIYGGKSQRVQAYRQACAMGARFLSKNAIRWELSDGGFSEEIVAQTMSRLFFDWEEHACRFTAAFVKGLEGEGYMPYPSTILDVLSDEGFTERQARAGLASVEFPWEQAAADIILEGARQGGPAWVAKQLRSKGFSDETIEEAERLVNYDGVDWNRQAQFILGDALASLPLEPEEIRERMLRRGLSEQSVEYAFAHAVLPERTDWDEQAVTYVREVEEESHYSPKELAEHLEEEGMRPEKIQRILKRSGINWKDEATENLRKLLMDDGYEDIPEAADVLAERGFSKKQIESATRRIEISGNWITTMPNNS